MNWRRDATFPTPNLTTPIHWPPRCVELTIKNGTPSSSSDIRLAASDRSTALGRSRTARGRSRHVRLLRLSTVTVQTLNTHVGGIKPQAKPCLMMLDSQMGSARS